MRAKSKELKSITQSVKKQSPQEKAIPKKGINNTPFDGYRESYENVKFALLIANGNIIIAQKNTQYLF